MTVTVPVVCLTGVRGWLGRCLAQSLVGGLEDQPGIEAPFSESEKRALDSRPGGALEGWIAAAGDVRVMRDCEALVDGASDGVLIHSAGVIHPRRVREFYEVNVTGTLNLARAAAAAGMRRFVCISSNSPCGTNPTRAHRFDESSPYNPYMNYGRSKMLMEQQLVEFCESVPMEVVIIRAPWFYGPEQPARQTLFFRMVRDGKAPLLGDGGQVRSMAYVDNLSQGIMLAATHPAAANKTFWVADREPYTMRQIIEAIEDVLEADFDIPCKHRRLRLPHVTGQVAQLVDWSLQRIGFYHQKIHVLSEMNKTIACDVSRAITELGYDPQVSLREGMRRSVAWIMDTEPRLLR